MTILKATILLSLFACVEMWPRGAPNTTCVSMMPGHGRPRQAGPSPYTLTLSKKTYTPNENVQLTLSGSRPFKGFLIKPTIPGTPTLSGIGLPGTIPASGQAADTAAPVGALATSPQAKNNCPFPSLTHTNNNTKESLTFTWTAPSSDQGQIVFQYTVVQNKNVYWVNMETDPVTYRPDSTNNPNNPNGSNNPNSPNNPNGSNNPNSQNNPNGSKNPNSQNNPNGQNNPNNQNRPISPDNSSYRARPSIIAVVFSFLSRVFKGWM